MFESNIEILENADASPAKNTAAFISIQTT